MRKLLLLTAIVAGVPDASLAGEVPLYQPPQAWTESADLVAAAKRVKGPLVIHDMQLRFEGAKSSAYVDIAVRIETPQALTQNGTLAALWFPDKGDLTIHRATLLRDGVTIDLLQGGKFEVLRREGQLEARTITGMLTATMPVSGARVGDIIRMSYTVEVLDPALKGNFQRMDVLPAGIFQPGVGRIRYSWPAARKVAVAVTQRAVTLPDPKIANGFATLEVALPLAPPGEMPEDAPPRYAAPAILQATSFTGWTDVSRTMAPLFATTGLIKDGDAIAAEVDKIAAASPDPAVRTAMALRLVQDRISYLANGMNGGNYIPQVPAETWSSRNGDCKAKTLLLLVMLDRLGIKAEAVLVSAGRPDSVASALPMVSAFDHVIVRAEAAGGELWLDGTVIGTRLASLGDVPAFRNGLPLRAEGAELLVLPARALQLPSLTITEQLDLSAGIDFPALFDLKLEMAGALAGPFQQLSMMPDGKERNELIDSVITTAKGEAQILTRELTFDAERGVAVVSARGLHTTPWERSSLRAQFSPNLIGKGITFQPNRSRAAWQAIPVALQGPDRQRQRLTVMLPDKGAGFSLQGATLQAQGAGYTLRRNAELVDGKLVIEEELSAAGGELSANAIATERASLATIAAGELRLQAPADALRAFEIRGPADRRRLKSIEAAYAALIAADPDQATSLVNRASFLSGIRDHAAALADLDRAIAIDATADLHGKRADTRVALGQLELAIKDAKLANELDPQPFRLAFHAKLMGQAGDAAEALRMVDQALAAGTADRVALTGVRADQLATLGRKSEGLAAIDALLAERPGDVSVLNEQCWYLAAWDYAPERMGKDCDAAVQAANWAPAVLDSRAMAKLRLGRFDEALADTNAALLRYAGQDQTLLLRGIIRRRMGDVGGAADIAEALRRRPGLRKEYTDYGIMP